MIPDRVERSSVLLTILLAICQLTACSNETNSQLESGLLSVEFLLGDSALPTPLPTMTFRPHTGNEPTQNIFEGRLSVPATTSPGGMQVQTDKFELAPNPSLRVSELPQISIGLVQDGTDLIPVQRGLQDGAHPYWAFIPGPGKAWDDPADSGWTRAALPFSLQEKNQNCTHNGLLTFVFKSNGEISRLAYQVGSETCQYMKVDLWGMLEASYRAGPVEEKLATIDAYRKETGARLRVRPIETIARDYPAIKPGAFAPPGKDHVSVYGFVIDDVHYRGGCQTRNGPHPFCDVIDLPSYSLAKSILGGLVFLHLEQKYPGFADSLVVDWVCLAGRPLEWGHRSQSYEHGYGHL
jgi:hypothetical protein